MLFTNHIKTENIPHKSVQWWALLLAVNKTSNTCSHPTMKTGSEVLCFVCRTNHSFLLKQSSVNSHFSQRQIPQGPVLWATWFLRVLFYAMLFCIFSSPCSVNIVMFMLALENMSQNLLMVGFVFVSSLFLMTQEPSISFKFYGQFSSLTILK